MTIDIKTNWNAFFSSLAFAEKAAADQCALISKYFRDQGKNDLADIYEQFHKEEVGHYEMVKTLVDGELTATEKAKKVYNGHLLTDENCIIERLAAVHLAFEPSALAFLGHIYVNAERYFEDQEKAKKVKNLFGTIIREEVNHIFSGKDLIKQLLKEANSEIKNRNVRRSLKLHKAFLSLGLKTFFDEHSETKQHIDAMLSNYDTKFENISSDIFEDDITKPEKASGYADLPSPVAH